MLEKPELLANLFYNKSKWLWLSHVLNSITPGYRGNTDIKITVTKSIEKADSCNQLEINLSNHVGTHVDAPYHFVQDGKRVDEYLPGDWIFLNIWLIDLSERNFKEITEEIIAPDSDFNDSVDLVLFKTGCEKYRNEKKYWSDSPVFKAELAQALKARFPNIKAIGMDVLSLTSLQNREEGRKAHKAFLEENIRIFEDMKLSPLSKNVMPKIIIASPLRVEDADGSPCTIMGAL